MSRRRILFFLYHAGYLRHYAEPIRLLALRGDVFHLGFTVVEKDDGDTALAERLAAEFPGQITYGVAPTRRHWDGWRRTSIVVRAFTDLSRYIDERYADAPALRERMAAKIKRQIFSGRADPVTSRLLTSAVDRLAARTDAKTGKRLLRFLRLAERAVPTSSVIDAFIRDWNPDAVFVTPLVEYTSNQVDYLKSAHRLGIPTAAAIASWDNLTNKGLLRFEPDRVLVWNEVQRRELEELHGVPGDRAIVTGGQKFDPWFELTPTRSAAEHRAMVGLDDRDYLLYACSSFFIAPDEVSFVRRWIEALRASDDPAVRDLAVLVRPHPQNYNQWADVDLGADGAIWPRGGSNWPDLPDAKAAFYDSIHYSRAVVGVNTSAMIDSAIIGRNVMTILDPAFAATQEGTLHFHYLLRENGGFLTVARDLAEHAQQVGEILHGGAAEEQRVREFIGSFVRPRGIDTPVTPIVAEAIQEIAGLPRHAERRTTSPAVYAMRLALRIPSVLATATLFFGFVLERVSARALERRAQRRASTKGAA